MDLPDMAGSNPSKGSSAGLEDFRTLSSTKQNVELFKILSAIAGEIENLKRSTERRFVNLETIGEGRKLCRVAILSVGISCLYQ